MDSILLVHVIDSLRVGGAQTHLLTMLREEVTTGRASHRVISLFDDGPIGDEIRTLGVPVEALDLAPLLRRRGYRSAARLLQARLRELQPAIVEAHLTYSRVLGLYAAWRERVPQRIAFEHGDLYLTSPKFRVAHFIGQRFAHRVIVVSEALAAWARQTYGLSRGKTVILHNCVDLDRFREGAVTPATDLDLPETATKLAAVGTLGTGVNKRVDVLIRAVADARRSGADVTLAVCGDGELRPELERLAASLGVGEKIRFLGMRQDVPAVLAACDVFVHAAEFEPFGIVAVEALAQGLPIVVPDAGGMVEAVEPGMTGLVYPVLDHRALAEKLVWLYEHPGEVAHMCRAARRSAEERFSVDVYMDRLYALYGISTGSLDGGPS